jgi:hypothetical protein
MAGQDEAMVLAARVVDQFSPTLKQMQRSLRSVAAETGGFHKQGIVQSKSHTEALLQLRREVTNVGERVKAGLTPALAGLGISGLSASAGITAVAKSIVDFAGNARHLTFLSHQTQLTVQQLRVFEELAPRIGTSVEAMDSALAGFSEHMEKLRRSPLAVLRESFAALNVRPDPAVISGWRNLIGSLHGLGRADQLGKIVQYLDRIRDMGQKRAVLQAFGLPPEFANKTAKELQEAINEIQKRLKPLTPEQLKGGIEFQESIENIKTSLHGLRDAVGADLAKDMSALATSLEQFMSVHKGDIVEAIRDLATWARSVDWAGIGADLKTFASGANSVAESLGGWKPILEFLLVYKVANILGLTHALGGLAGALGTLGAVASPPAWLLGLLGVAGAVAADKDRQKRGDKGPGGLYGTPLYGFGPMGEAETIPQGGAHGDAGPTGSIGNLPSGTAQRPLWRRLFDSINKDGGLLGKTGGIRNGIQPAGFTVEGGGPNPLLGGADRGLEGIIERGTLAALQDFARGEGASGGGGGGGGAGGAMSAIRANYSPGGGGGYSGAGAGTGEPAGGGGGVAGTGTTSPMGELRGLAGGLPKGIESLRSFHAPSIPAGMGDTVADHLKGAGVNLPPHLDAKIRGGGQVTEGDLKALPPHILEKANRAITGAGRPPLYTDAKPPHFSVGAIRDSLRGTAAAPLEAGQIDRSRFAKELEQNPALRDKVMRIAANEQGRHPQGTQSVMESMMNRAEVRGTNLETQARWFRREKGGYYEMGNMGRGALENPGHRAVLERSLSNTLAGGNVSNYATDNSSGGLAARERASGKFKFQSAAHGETFFSPGWGEPGWQRNYAQWRSRLADQDKAAAARPMPNIGAALGGTDVEARHGAALRSHFGHRAHPDLLGAGRQAGIVGPPMRHKVTGSATLDVNFNGAPQGTTHRLKADGMFKQIKLSRGRAMPPASQEG